MSRVSAKPEYGVEWFDKADQSDPLNQSRSILCTMPDYKIHFMWSHEDPEQMKIVIRKEGTEKQFIITPKEA